MPVLGHAIVGLAIGVSTKPSARGHPEPPGIGATSEFWLPAVVALAYLPDIVAQLGLIAEWSDSRLLGHSVLFAVVVPRRSRGCGCKRLVWLGRAFIVAVVLAAVMTHALRDARETQFETGRNLVEHRAYQAGFEALALAERWPSTTKPGRIDYVRAEAYAGMGDRRRAEAYYLRAYRADRTYFWIVADLALFYASSEEPVAERRRLATPYLRRLRSEYAGEPALPKVLTRVERKLAAPRPGWAPNSPSALDAAAPVPAHEPN